MNKPILEVYNCQKLEEFKHADFLKTEYPDDERMYLLALLQQEADQRAIANRKDWRVVQGGKSNNVQLQPDGQLRWAF